MNTKQFKYVQVLAREGSFSLAAEQLQISQPSLSQYVRKIEKEIGIALFDRAGSRVRLTDAGYIYLEAAGKILDLEQQMEKQFSDLAEHSCGKIVVGISPHRSIWFMPQIVAKFRQQYPDVQIILEEKVGHELLDGARDGAFDLCVTTLPVNENLFEYEYLMKEEIVLAVSVRSKVYHTLEAAVQGKMHPVIPVQMLDGMDFVMLGSTQLMQQTAERICDKYRIAFRKVVECRSIESQMAMVGAAVGMALVPSSIARFSSDKSIKFYSLDLGAEDREVAVIYRRGQYLSKSIKRLIDLMKHTH